MKKKDISLLTEINGNKNELNNLLSTSTSIQIRRCFAEERAL